MIFSYAAAGFRLAPFVNILLKNIKTIVRRFKKIFGLSPKHFSYSIHFNGVFYEIKSGNVQDIQSIVYQHGNYGQLHFNNKFKNIPA